VRIARSTWVFIGEPTPLTSKSSPRGREELSQMDYNPFVAELRATDDEIKKLEHRRDDLVEQVTWSTRFNPEEEVGEIARLRSDLEERTAELARLEEDITELDATSRLLASQTPGLERDARLGLRVFRWFTPEYDSAKARLMAHKQELVRHSGRVEVVDEERKQVAREVSELTDHLFDKEQALARFMSFRSDEVGEAIAEIAGELPLLEKKRDHLKARTADVDRAVEAPLAELRKYESEIEDRESTISNLRSELSRLERQIAEAERIDRKISNAANSYEKAKLHQECERELGEGRPWAAIRAIRSQMRSPQRDISDHERQIDRIGRDKAKTEMRITMLAAVAARDIDALIIDGNNCCYQHNDFIGLAALIPMTDNLAEGYAVTVIFDAAIRRLLGVSDEELREALPAAKVHVVASRTKADETILDAADEPTVWVVSNDRFGDYRDKTPVKEDRLIKHEIVSGRIFVHDLRVNEPLAVQSGA
jgi:hypothetical protein